MRSIRTLHELRKRCGRARADRAYELSKEAVDSLGSLAQELSFDNFQWTNSLYCAAATKHLDSLQAEYEARLELGLAVDWLDSAALEQEIWHRRSGCDHFAMRGQDRCLPIHTCSSPA
jgi:hypothetical protein